MAENLAESPWPLTTAVAVFVAAGLVTVVGSVLLASLGDKLADRTGWGEALFGAVFFGVATSLSGIVMTATAASADRPELAYSNAVGGIVAQTMAIAVADGFYRRANLEHAAASLSNMLFGCLLIALLAVALLASSSPDVTMAGVHPGSFAMVAGYVGGLYLIRRRKREPMWEAVPTEETVPDEPDENEEHDDRSLGSLWTRFLAVVAVVAVGGWAIAEAAGVLVDATGLGSGFVGTVLMGIVNALPETVTAVAAVRRGALTLAVAGVLGGNCLDALNVAVGDVAFRGGSIYHAVEADQLFVTGSALLMTAVLLGGLLVRQRQGWGRLGFEGALLIAVYATVVVVQVL